MAPRSGSTFEPARTRRRLRALAASLLLAATMALAQDAPRGPLDLKPGEFLWHPEIAPDGPLHHLLGRPGLGSVALTGSPIAFGARVERS